MFIVNYEPITAPINQRAKNEFDAKKKEILAMKFPLKFGIKRLLLRDKKGNALPLKNEFLNYIATVITDNVAETWIYSTVAPSKDKDGKYHLADVGQIIKNTLVLNKEDIELIFFIMYKSYLFRTEKIFLIDEEKDADDRANSIKVEARFKFMMFDDESPLKREQLNVVARAYGVSNVEDLTENQIKTRLTDLLAARFKNEKDIYERFLGDLGLSKDIKIRSLVQQAIDERKIFYNPSRKAFEWVNEINPNEPNIIYPLAHDEFDKPLDGFVRWLKFSDDMFAQIRKSLNSKDDLTADDINKMDWNEKRAIAKEFGIKVHGRKEEELTKDIIEKLETR